MKFNIRKKIYKCVHFFNDYYLFISYWFRNMDYIVFKSRISKYGKLSNLYEISVRN